jgi:hypothetical protein
MEMLLMIDQRHFTKKLIKKEILKSGELQSMKTRQKGIQKKKSMVEMLRRWKGVLEKKC